MKNKLHVIHVFPQQNIPFRAGDHTLLREVLHPKNDGVDLPFSLASASLGVGESSLPHRLAQSETYYFTSGHGRIFIDGKEYKISAGHTILVPPGAEQYVVNESKVEMEFLCIVAPPWSEEGEEII